MVTQNVDDVDAITMRVDKEILHHECVAGDPEITLSRPICGAHRSTLRLPDPGYRPGCDHQATVNQALREFIARREQARIVELFGTLDWDGQFDYKRERSRQRICEEP